MSRRLGTWRERGNGSAWSGVRSLAVGSGHACALAGDDSVRCWGNNQNAGQLGTGNFGNASAPTAVVGS